MKKPFSLIICAALSIGAQAQNSDTDISKYSNVVFVQKGAYTPGTEMTLPVMLKTDMDAVGVQFRLCLPKGVSLVSNAKGDSYVVGTGSACSKKHMIDAAKRQDGTYTVLCYNFENEKFTSQSGDVAELTIKVDDSVTVNILPIVLRDVEIAKAGGKGSKIVDYVETDLMLSGDSDGIAETPQDEKSSTGTYNMLGQKVSKLQRGQAGVDNGKKVIVTK